MEKRWRENLSVHIIQWKDCEIYMQEVGMNIHSW